MKKRINLSYLALGASLIGLGIAGLAYLNVNKTSNLLQPQLTNLENVKTVNIQFTADCPKCSYDKFEIERNYVDMHEEGYCPECKYHYSQDLK